MLLSQLGDPLVRQRLVRGDILSRWWGFRWDAERVALRIYVHRFFLEHDPHAVYPYGPDLISSLTELGFGISDFCGNLRSLMGFGINGAFVPVDSCHPSFVEFLVPYPQVDRVVGACDRCDDYGGATHCLACQGSGERREIDWQAVNAISFSLHLFFRTVQFPDALPVHDEPQLMEIEVSAGRDRAGISGEFSLPFRAWLSSRLRNSRIDEAERAMAQAHMRLFGLSDMDPSLAAFQFRAGIDFDAGWLNMSCPGFGGGGASIHPNHSSFCDPGYEFLSHGMDTPMQMLTILAGLAALHEKVDPVWRATMPVESQRIAS